MIIINFKLANTGHIHIYPTPPLGQDMKQDSLVCCTPGDQNVKISILYTHLFLPTPLSLSFIYIYIYIYIYIREAVWSNEYSFLLNKIDGSVYIIFTNPSARTGYDTRSVFKRSLTGLKSVFLRD